MKTSKPQAALDALSRRLQDERDLSNIVHFFFDEVGESRWIHRGSAPVRHERLESVLSACVGRLPGPATEAVEIYASRYDKTDFIHGLVVMGRGLSFERLAFSENTATPTTPTCCGVPRRAE